MTHLYKGEQLFKIRGDGPLFLVRAVGDADGTALQQLNTEFDTLRTRLAAAETETTDFIHKNDILTEQLTAMTDARDEAEAWLEGAVMLLVESREWCGRDASEIVPTRMSEYEERRDAFLSAFLAKLEAEK